MKKLTTTLAAIVAILMMVLPLTASAEQIDVTAFQLVDPIVSMNDQPLLDMTGLTVQLAGGSTADGSLTQVFLDVLAGGETANSAVLQFSDDGIVGYLGGMQNAYGVTTESLNALPIEGLGDMNFGELMAALKNWTLPEKLIALVEDTMANDFVMGDPETIELDLAAGTTSLTYVPFTMDATNYMLGIYDLLENDELLGPIIKAALVESGYDSFTDMLKDTGMTVQVSGGIATTDDASSVMVEMTESITVEGETVTEELNMLVDGSMGDAQTIDATIAIKGSEGEDVTVAMNGTAVGEDITLEGTVSEAQGEAATFTIAYASAAGAGNGTDKFDASFDAAGEGSLSLSASSVEETGETHFEIAAKDDATDASGYFTFTPAETAVEGAIASGTIELGASDGVDTYSLTSTANLVATTIDTDNFYIDPATAVDLTTITPEQEEAAATDLGLAMIQTLTKLEAGVPGLVGISAGLFGSSAQ